MSPDDARFAVMAAIGDVAPDAPVAQLGGDDDLVESLELDSMDLLNVVVAVHERTGVEIPERDYGQLTTLDLFVAYLVAAG